MTKEDPSQSYPYKFGGITTKKNNDPKLERLLPSKPPNFFKLYTELLNSIQKKDSKALDSLLEPDLIKPLLSRNVKLVHASSSSIIQFNTFAIGIGDGGKRDPRKKFISTCRSVTNKNVKFYTPNFTTFFLNHLNPLKFRYLLSAEITIRSKARLIETTSTIKQQEQTHILTFQRQLHLNIFSAMIFMPKMEIIMAGKSR